MTRPTGGQQLESHTVRLQQQWAVIQSEAQSLRHLVETRVLQLGEIGILLEDAPATQCAWVECVMEAGERGVQGSQMQLKHKINYL